MLQCLALCAHPERSSVMQAIVIVSNADGGTLEYRDVPDPTPRPGELLVRVRATGLNRADLAQRRGAYPRPATGGDSALNLAGLEAAGEVVGLAGVYGGLMFKSP